MGFAIGSIPPNKRTNSQYRKELKERWGSSIKCLEEYITRETHILHKCSKGHKFKAKPYSLLTGKFVRGTPCPECYTLMGSVKRKTQEQYEKQVRSIHKTITVIGKYLGANIHCRHKCDICGYKWNALPDNVVNTSKTGCPRCNNSRGYSKKAIAWLKEEARKRKIRIRHAQNWGEYYIPELYSQRIKVDGYHAPTRTIFEFYGSCFHGDLKVFKPRQRCHPFSNSTAQALYKATMKREELLKSFGYKIVSIWESDYDKNRKS